jgi:hypothetical protein
MGSEGLGIMRIGSKEMMFDMVKAGVKKNVLSISNRVYFYFGNLRFLGVPDDAIDSFRRLVGNVLGFGVLTSRTEYPSIPLVTLTESQKREEIKAGFTQILKLVGSR